MISSKSKYYRTKLKTADEKAIYDKILSTLESQQSEVIIKTNLLSSFNRSLDSIVTYVGMDNPGLFYVNFQHYKTLANLFQTKLMFEFLVPIEKIDNVERKLQAKIANITMGLSNLPQYDKEIALHDYLVTTVKYEYDDMRYHKAHSSVGALLHGRAICEGYAKAFKLLCDAVGMSCIVVYGTATNLKGTEHHAWNIVKLDKKCYHVDVTWDSTVKLSQNSCYDYFNLTDGEILKDHVWNKSLLPPCTATEDNYFVKNEIIVKNSDELKAVIKAQLKAKKHCFSIKFIGNVPKDNNQAIERVNKAVAQSSIMKLIGSSSLSMRYNEKQSIAEIKLK